MAEFLGGWKRDLRCGEVSEALAGQQVTLIHRRDELPDCYAAADLFAFSSRTETQGLVLLGSAKRRLWAEKTSQIEHQNRL